MTISRSLMASLAVAAVSSAALFAGCGGGTTVDFTTRNGERATIDLGAQGASQGDILSVEGDLLDTGGAAIGRFDLKATTTDFADGRESRQTMAEVDWKDSDDALLFAGANSYPAGGGIPDEPIRLAVIGGTGQYAGAGGEATITPTKQPGLFNWSVTLN